MSIDSPRYDVALSFLSRDEPTASAFADRLRENLEVFFFPRSQEELAGTDGLESMRTPFFSDSRVAVVLYRQPWGKTPWTRVEETAIKESCLEFGWDRLFFVVLDQMDALPVWVPKNLVRFNYGDFGIEQAVGAIKARVQENGGQPTPLSAMKRAEIFKAEELFRKDRLRMSSPEGMQSVMRGVADLLRRIEKRCSEIRKQGLAQVTCEVDFQEGNITQTCVVTDGSVGMTVNWRQRFSNSLADSGLVVREFDRGLILPSQIANRTYFEKPNLLDEKKYSPELSRAREYGWAKEGTGFFMSTADLAEQCVIEFLDLANRKASGDL